MSDKNGKSIFIPKGLAHGFKALEENSIMLYNVTTGYDPNCDSGILYNSFYFDWEIKNPIVSDRDKALEKLDSFEKGDFLND